jgi:hypothetical protein
MAESYRKVTFHPAYRFSVGRSRPASGRNRPIFTLAAFSGRRRRHSASSDLPSQGHRALPEYRPLGRTDIRVSAICLGTMTWGQQNTEAEGHAQMDMALDHGINFFDTAEV